MRTAKRLILLVIEKIHFLIFKQKMSQRMREFLSHTVWSFSGVFINAFIFFILNILAGRLLGPVGYGNYNLVIAITTTVAVLMIPGIDNTAIKYIATMNKEEEKNAVMSNSLMMAIPFSAAVFILLLISHTFLARLLHTDPILIIIAVLFSLIYAYKNLLDHFIIAFKQFRLQAFIKAAEALVALLLFIFFFFILKSQTYQLYTYAIAVGGIGAIIIYGKFIFYRLRYWNKKIFQQEKSYLKTFIIFAAVGTLLNSIDRFFIVHYLGAGELGIYGAYLLSATAIVSQCILIINNVFFPMASQVSDKLELLNTLNRLLVLASAPVILLTIGVSYAILLLFGHQYVVHWNWIILVSTIAFFQIISSLYNTMLFSSNEHFSMGVKIYCVKPIFAILLYFLLYHFNIINIQNILCVLLLTYAYDAANTLITFKLIKPKINVR